MKSITSRTYSDSDLLPLCDFLNFCDSTDKIDDVSTPDNVSIWINRPDRDIERDVRIWHAGEGDIAAFAQLLIPEGEGEVEGFFYARIHPDYRSDPDRMEDGLEGEVIGWATETLREVAAERGASAVLRPSASGESPYWRGVLESRGFVADRYNFTMHRPLSTPIAEPQMPPGFTVRPVVDSEQDVERWVELYNESFMGEWGFHPISVAEKRHRMSSVHYRSDGDLILVADDGIMAAFCSCFIELDENAARGRSEGWIGQLGTRPEFRHRGLGRAALRAGLKWLKEQELETAKLGVDADNPTGALRLYKSEGFTQLNSYVFYSLRV